MSTHVKNQQTKQRMSWICPQRAETTPRDVEISRISLHRKGSARESPELSFHLLLALQCPPMGSAAWHEFHLFLLLKPQMDQNPCAGVGICPSAQSCPRAWQGFMGERDLWGKEMGGERDLWGKRDLWGGKGFISWQLCTTLHPSIPHFSTSRGILMPSSTSPCQFHGAGKVGNARVGAQGWHTGDKPGRRGIPRAQHPSGTEKREKWRFQMSLEG